MPLEQLQPRGSSYGVAQPRSGTRGGPDSGVPLPLSSYARRAASQSSRPGSSNVETVNSTNTVLSRVDESSSLPSNAFGDVRPGFVSTSGERASNYTSGTSVGSVARSNAVSSVSPVRGLSNIGPARDHLRKHGGNEEKQHGSGITYAALAQSAMSAGLQAQDVSNKEDSHDDRHAPIVQASTQPPN